ncbi:MAG: caspase family protein [Spirochaetaceae bacterium]|nr:caspase family protein [Spirochaetaceae bacterium]
MKIRIIIYSAVLFFILNSGAAAQEKYALIIGNAAYRAVGKLTNPVNDANDIKTTLAALGFEVELLPNATLGQMEDGAIRLRNKLLRGSGAYGFFYYAGHAVQSKGQNYLIPVDADIKSESMLREKAFNVQTLLGELEEAKNILNVVVLDACRDFPAAWSRGGSRGLAVVSEQPTGTIVMYATSAGKTAADGAGRNGLFTSQLLKNLGTANIEVSEIFKRTGASVIEASGNEQFPELSIKFFGNAYFSGGAKVHIETPMYVVTPPTPAPSPSPPPPEGTGEFGGTWNGAISYNDRGGSYRDTYTIALYDDGSCSVSVRAEDGASQSGEGYWSAENEVFKLECDFPAAAIARLKSIDWKSVYRFENNKRRLRVNIKPSSAYSGVVGLTLNKGR